MTRLAAALVAALLLGACLGPGEPDPATPTAAGTADVLEARAVLGDPLVNLAEEAIALADDLDAVRHEVPRGGPMRRAVRLLRESTRALAEAAEAAREAADRAPVAAAAELVRDAATRADEAVDAAAEEAAFMASVAALDRDLAEAADVWDAPGSQAEQRRRLTGQAAELERLERRAARLRPVPATCTAMRDRRITWARTVRVRTEKLADNATSAGGTSYDELRAAYRREPLGEDPLRADAADRGCWQDASAVPAVAEALRSDVDALRDLLA